MAQWTHDKGTDSSPSFGIHVEDGKKSNFFCFTCQEKGNMYELVSKLAQLTMETGSNTHRDFELAWDLVRAEDEEVDELDDLADLKSFNYDDYQKSQQGPEFHEFSEAWLESFQPGWEHPYMKERGIPTAVGRRLNVRFDSHRNRICFPAYTFDGQLAGLHGRAIDSAEGPKYFAYGNEHQERNPHVWTGENHLDLDQPVVICEGPFDYAKVYCVTTNVACCRSASFSSDMADRIKAAPRIISFFDVGTGGDRGRERCEKLFQSSSLVHVVPPDPWGDAGEMPVPDIAEVLSDVIG